MHTGLVRRSSGWRVWIVALTVALVGAGPVAAAWHGDLAGDPDCCAICQLRHQPATEPSGVLEVGSANAAERLDPQPRCGWMPSGRFSRLPARAPPA